MNPIGFRKTVYRYYRAQGRDLPWRKTKDPYHILVSEIMLQQTQVSRVLIKCPLFLKTFPTIQALAQAPFRRVLRAWQGLGYNRRALSLHALAQRVVKEFGGKIPKDPQVLQTLPGIGKATAASICAFAFNQPIVFIETNIRSVFIHHFFKDKKGISDEQLVPYIQKTLDRRNPRKWYNALMDYGVYLKTIHVNPSRKSLHYRTQSPFHGSNRQLRGEILRLLTLKTKLEEYDLYKKIPAQKARLRCIIETLRREGFITNTKGYLSIR